MFPSRWLPVLAGLALLFPGSARVSGQLPETGLFARTNLMAWCIVPFDSKKRGPEERAAMLEGLGLRRLAYDWRAEHLPTFDAEIAALDRHGIELTAWWFPAALNAEARAILDCLARNRRHPQLWVTMGTEPETDPARLAGKIEAAVGTLGPICAEAARLGSVVGLYNHLGWFGEPANQVRVLAGLRAAGHTNAGCVYNFHHAHAHLDRFAGHFRILQPHLIALNLNGMVRDGDRVGRKIIPLGTGEEELRLLRLVRSSGWNGPVGIIGHTDEDAELKLQAELAGLARLVPLTGPARGRSGPAAGPRRAAGEPGISGREPGSQGEKDWVDNRWPEMEVGQWLASVLPLPTGTVAKGLSIKVGKEDEGTVAYDTASGAFRAAWQGGFLQLPAGRFGLIDAPKPDGTNLLAVPAGPGWPGAEYRFTGFHRHHQRVVLEHRVHGVRVLESPWLVYRRVPVVLRTLNLEPSSRPLRVVAGGAAPGGDPAVALSSRPGLTQASVKVSGREWRVAVKGAEAGLQVEPDGRWVAEFPPSAAPRRVVLLLAAGADAAAWESVLAEVEADDLRPWLGGDSGRYLGELKTVGQRGADADFLAVDTLTLPYDNPWQALLFAAGVDFTPDGAGYLGTMHGDVWRVTGIDDALRELRWKRFATGLFQPLGLKVRDGEVFVLGRDRITRLRDLNGDGEADFYENFHDGIATSTGGHDYVTSLERDEAGRFYYIDPAGVHRVSRDGSAAETLATGFRNPNGMGVRPDGRVITAAPQQGTWTPSSGLWEIRPGLYGGYGGPRVTPERPQGFDAPLLWLPHGVDNSSGGQVWLPDGVWGPLGGQMLHLLWGRCSAMLVLRDAAAGGAGIQGAAVPLPVKFLSGPNRATYRTQDGHLYVAGSTGWQTSAVKDGALQRVRFTGRPAQLPVRFRVLADGLEVGFAAPLDRGTAEDPGSYALKRWNYRYAQEYGSKDWSVANPGMVGRDEVGVASATLLADGRTVRLGVPALVPAMQMELKYNLDPAGGGRPAQGQFWFTVNAPAAAGPP